MGCFFYFLLRRIKLINQSNNKDLLEEFYNYLNKENKTQNLYKLSKEQYAAVGEGRDDIENGNYLMNEQADEEIDKWLKKKFGREKLKVKEKRF